MTAQNRSGWINAHWTDVAPGDTIRPLDERSDVKVIDRTFTEFTNAQFQVRLSDGRSLIVGKLSRVEILDVHGRVSERILGYTLPGGEHE